MHELRKELDEARRSLRLGQGVRPDLRETTASLRTGQTRRVHFREPADHRGRQYTHTPQDPLPVVAAAEDRRQVSDRPAQRAYSA